MLHVLDINLPYYTNSYFTSHIWECNHNSNNEIAKVVKWTIPKSMSTIIIILAKDLVTKQLWCGENLAAEGLRALLGIPTSRNRILGIYCHLSFSSSFLFMFPLMQLRIQILESLTPILRNLDVAFLGTLARSKTKVENQRMLMNLMLAVWILTFVHQNIMTKK